MLQATDALPLNFGLTGKGNTSLPDGLVDQIRAGADRPQAARGLGHDAGRHRLLPRASPRRRTCRSRSTPTRSTSRATSTTRSPRSRAARSTPTTPRARAAATRRTSSACAASRTSCPSSTNPTRPYTVNTLDEHLDMLMVCHHLDREHPRGRGVRREPHPRRDDRRRGHPPRPRRDQHHRRSDSQAMGRVGEVITRTWQTARQDEGAARAARRASSGDNDNFRIRRYVAKYTINPAIAHGMAHDDRLGRGRASWPTSCCGGRRSSASSRSWCSRAASSPGRRWATRTRRSRRRSRRTCGRCSARSGRATGATQHRVRLAARASQRATSPRSASRKRLDRGPRAAAASASAT